MSTATSRNSDAPETMNLEFAGQLDFCARLGLTRRDDDRFFPSNPQALEVMELLDRMRVERDRMTSAARWIRDGLERGDRRFDGAEIHATVSSSDRVAQQAVEYDMALTAYCTLQDQLTKLVNKIRRGQGYDPDAYTRLEQHPALSPEDDRTVRALAALERHLADQQAYTPGAQRRHLREDHGVKATPNTGPAPALLHESAHADDLAALQQRVQQIQEAQR
jgi:hypothetical protein